MTDASAATIGFFALVAAVFGIFSDDFYASMIGTHGKRVPKWFGRLWFFGFAAIMLYLSLSHFLQPK